MKSRLEIQTAEKPAGGRPCVAARPARWCRGVVPVRSSAPPPCCRPGNGSSRAAMNRFSSSSFCHVDGPFLCGRFAPLSGFGPPFEGVDQEYFSHDTSYPVMPTALTLSLLPDNLQTPGCFLLSTSIFVLWSNRWMYPVDLPLHLPLRYAIETAKPMVIFAKSGTSKRAAQSVDHPAHFLNRLAARAGTLSAILCFVGCGITHNSRPLMDEAR